MTQANDNGRAAYERDVISTITNLFSASAVSRRIGEADDEYAERTEARAQEIVSDALAKFKSAIQDAAALSDFFRSHSRYLLDALADNMPSKPAWDEHIAQAKQGARP